MTKIQLRNLIKEAIDETYSEFNWDDHLKGGNQDKWDLLEEDLKECIEPIIRKHSPNFGNDSYAVIDALYQVIEGMFPKIEK
jgi:heme oxygenase